MKMSVLLLPVLLEAALVLALHAHTPVVLPMNAMQREAEIREVRAEQGCIRKRLNVLESQGRVFLPRGMNVRH